MPSRTPPRVTRTSTHWPPRWSTPLDALDALAGLLAGQSAGYGACRALYDDEDANPDHRLRSAVLALTETRHGLAQAERAANRFWSAIGHIGIRHRQHQHDDEGDRS